jgi:hypothetical protein
MAVEIITKEDLQSFRNELLKELQLIMKHTTSLKPKQWLKSSEVRELLKISPGTLQNLRINGTLQFTKIGGIIYYNYEDIEVLLESGPNSKPDKISSVSKTQEVKQRSFHYQDRSIKP